MKQRRILRLLPLQFVVALLPLITYYYKGHSGYGSYGWHSVDDTYHDFFLHYKMICFIVVCAVMLVAVFFLRKKFGDGGWKKLLVSFAPLLMYLFFVVLSTIFSKDHALSFLGAMEQQEPFPVLLGYVVTAVYAWLVLENEEDLRAIVDAALLGAFLMAVLGVLQAVEMDPFKKEWGQKLITDNAVLEQYGLFVLRFPEGQAYGTLFNPNYVGSYVPLYAPLLFFGAVAGKRLWRKLACLISGIGLIVMLFASQSRTGMIALAAVLFVLIVFSAPYVLRYWYAVIGVVVVLAGGFLLFDWQQDFLMVGRLREMFEVRKEDYVLKGIDTTGNGVRVVYKDTEFVVQMPVSGTDFAYVVTEGGEPLDVTYSEDRAWGYATLKSGEQISIQTAIYEDYYAFGLPLDGSTWYFTNQIERGNYKFITDTGKTDECQIAPNALPGYESLADARGYVWGRTLPLLKKHFFIGSGPDTFAITFPQNDYVARYRVSPDGIIYTRPHNLYLQMALQTGVVSLVAFLAFCLIYAVECCKLYFAKKLTSGVDWIGFAIFLGIVGFLAASLANDSLVVVSPVFYAMLGAGKAVNRIKRGK